MLFLFGILTAWGLLVCLLLGVWTLFGTALVSLPLRYLPRVVAKYRLKRFILSGNKARVVCFGEREEGEEPGFHFVFDAALFGTLCLETLLFADITPPSAPQRAADFYGRTAEAYCYLDGRGVQLIGVLGRTADSQQLCLSVRRIKLSGRAKELLIRSDSISS